MRLFFLMIWLSLILAGCITPDANDSRGLGSPMLNAFQAAQAQTSSPFSLPLSKQAQAHALVGGILVIMVFVILRASQWKDK